jgi:hypothetical protein
MSNYNVAIIVSIIITGLLALGISFGVSEMFFSSSSWKKIVQLILAIFFMTTFYSPIKYILLKYMDIKGSEDE